VLPPARQVGGRRAIRRRGTVGDRSGP